MALIFSQLDKSAQDYILKRDVLFQGHKATLNLLIGSNDGNDCGSFFTNDCLQILLSTDVLEVGIKVPDFIQYCVPHRLSRRIFLTPVILKTKQLNNVFAITNATVDEIEPLIPPNEKVVHMQSVECDRSRFVIMDTDDAENSYRELCKTNSSLHWLHLAGRNFEWQRSQTNINIIRQHALGKVVEVNLEYLFDVQDKMILICRQSYMELDNPLPYLAQRAKENCPLIWVIQIKIDYDTELFDKASKLTPEEFLTNAAKLSSPLEQDLFQIYLKHTGNIIVLIDLCYRFVPNYEDKCRSLLSRLSKTKVKKIIMTCDSSSKNMLEDVLLTLSFRVVHFSVEDQIHFLCSFWKSSLLTKNSLQLFVKKAINVVNSACLPAHSSFTAKVEISIPLVTMMIAEIFHDAVMHPSVNELVTKLNLVNIFENFVDKKFKNYLTKFPTTLNEHESKVLYLKNHMHIATSSCISSAYIQNMLKSNYHEDELNAKSFLADALRNPEKSGIITEVVNEIPHFTHSLFVTYFTALFFAHNYELDTDFLLNHFYTDHFKVVRFMFNSILAKDRELHTAIVKHDALTAEAVLKSRNVDVNATDGGGRTALHLAASLRFSYCDPMHDWFDLPERPIGPRPRHLVELLLDRGAHINVRDVVLHFSPLEYALKTRCWDAMEYLLARGANRNDLNILQHLYSDIAKFAIVNGYMNLLMLLFDSGLSVEFAVDRGLTLLHNACWYGHIEIVNFLLNRGADKQAFTIDGENPLHRAVRRGQLAVVQSLIQGNKPVKVLKIFKGTQLLKKYVDVTTSGGESPLLIASSGNSSEVIRLLVRHGADISVVDRNGQSCLHRACHNGNYDVARTVLEMFLHRKDASGFINKLDKCGESAIYIAVKSNHVDVVKLLISNGSVFLNCKGKSMLHWASQYGFLDAVNVIKDAFINKLDIVDDRGKSALHLATWVAHAAIVELLTGNGADVWLRDFRGRTCVHLAAWKGNLCILQALLNNVRDRKSIVDNINVIDGDGKTALHLASYWGHTYTDVIQLLILHGGDPRLIDEDGRSCLHLTSWRGNLSGVQEVINNLTLDRTSVVTYVNTRDKSGKSPLHLASYWGHSDVVRLLILNGADVWTDDNEGNTCLHWAARQRELNAAQAIVESLEGNKDDVFKYVNALNNDGLTASDLAVITDVRVEPRAFLAWFEIILKESSPSI